jgi:hypothetical protein
VALTENCEGFIMAMISTPGVYSLTIVESLDTGPGTGATITSVSSCGLNRTS